MQIRRMSIASLALAICAIAVPPSARASESGGVRAAPTGPAVRLDTVVAPSLEIRLDSMTMRFSRAPKMEVVAGVDVVQVSRRAQEGIQVDAVSHALRNAVRSGDVSPGTFNRAILDALVDDVGIDMATTIAKSYRPSADSYRHVIRAMRDRSLASSRGRTPATS